MRGCAVEVLMLIGLVVINGLFAMSEIALVTARKARLMKLAADGDRARTRSSGGNITMSEQIEVIRAPQVVYVYEAPVRIWHWINALAILVLCVSGYFIGSPLPSMPGEASDHYTMGYIRFAHFAAGQVMAVGLLGRAYWACVGNHHAHELFTLPLFRQEYWREVRAMLAWYAFLRPRPNQYVGHNPMARLAMFFGFLWMSVFMIATGFALYGEGAQEGSWAHTAFTSWVIDSPGSPGSPVVVSGVASVVPPLASLSPVSSLPTPVSSPCVSPGPVVAGPLVVASLVVGASFRLRQ